MSAVLLALVVIAAAGSLRQARLAAGRARVRALRSSRRRAPSLRFLLRVPAALAARRQARALARGMPDALDELARSLRSGASLGQALQEVGGAGGPAGEALASLGVRAGAGAGLAGEAACWATSSSTPEVRAAAAAIALGAAGAASPSLGVEAVASGLRARHNAAAEVRAHSAQARLSAAVLAVLPVAFTAWVAITQPPAVAFLLGTAPGLTCLGLGLALEVAGVTWIAAILRDAA